MGITKIFGMILLYLLCAFLRNIHIFYICFKFGPRRKFDENLPHMGQIEGKISDGFDSKNVLSEEVRLSQKKLRANSNNRIHSKTRILVNITLNLYHTSEKNLSTKA